MTEEEAKKKWCPFARVPSNGAVANRDNANDALITNIEMAARCIGSDCMVFKFLNTKDSGYCGIADRR